MKIDPNRFQQILMNLAATARDAMPRGGVLEERVEFLQKPCSPQDLAAGWTRFSNVVVALDVDPARR